jgi:PhzF family phenazine biosynthesis protein
MLKLPLYQVDAFTSQPFAGNPAAVCPLQAPIPEALMQDIAAENNLAETAFFHPQGDGFSLRWFTPTVEVDLCGHATLASAFVLMTELEPLRTKVVFHSRSGALPVQRDGDLFVLDFPTRPALPVVDLSAVVIAALGGARPIEVLRAQIIVAVYETADEVRRLVPDMVAIARLGTPVCVTAPGDGQPSGVDFVSRFFAPAHGIPEDPVTGSSFCTLAPYWTARLDRTVLRARQVSRRGGDVRCELVGERVRIAGQARLVLTGTLYV